VADEHAVLFEKRHHVRHCAKRRQNDGVEQKLAQPRRDLGAAGRLLAQRPRQLERDAGTGQTAERIGRAVAGRRQAWMNQRVGLRQGRLELMVIGDDEFQAQAACLLCFLNAGDAAIDGHDRFDSAFRQPPQGRAVEAVAVFQAIGDVEFDLGAEDAQAGEQDRGAGDAVDIVIAVHADSALIRHGRSRRSTACGMPGNSSGSCSPVSGACRNRCACSGSLIFRLSKSCAMIGATRKLRLS